jgi:hypothetical protein
MSEAALIEDHGITFSPEEVEEETSEIQETESAPVEQEVTPAEETPEETEDVMTERAQKRFNKITAEKYAEKQRADALQLKLDEAQAKRETVRDAPKLEDFDYDEDQHRSALIKYQVAEELKAERQALQAESKQAKAAEAQSAFNERIAALNKPDFYEAANSVPVLPVGVADALVQSENGAELIYHLGTHLDLADKLANMSPTMAMMELGRISVNLNAKPKAKLSAAPDPIEPLKSGGSISKERGPSGAKYE